MNTPGASRQYREHLAWLFRTQRFGIKLGLENIQRLLDALALPDAARTIIHVAGTNGKGSVCAMIDSLCRAQGHRTGLFTSPHLVTFRERIQVDGALIGEEEAGEGLGLIRDIARGWDPHPTFFEIATALALTHFREKRCEIVVLETGMGGRLDATNAVRPAVSVITPIDFDHQKWLGNTLPEIAAEKAGIIKPGIPAVSSEQRPEAAEVLRSRARECDTQLEFVTEAYGGFVALAGSHQRQNAAVALAACRRAGIEVSPAAVSAGLTNVRWPARFELFDDRIVIDGAHNPAGARALVDTWQKHFGHERPTVVFGALADKDIAASWRELRQIAAAAILPQFRGERVVPPDEVAKIVEAVSPALPRVVVHSTSDAIVAARKRPGRILICGSLHLAGEAIAHLRGIPAAFEECAQ